MTSLTFYGGVNEIGGNKILLEDKNTKIFLDFGKSFGKRKQFFQEFLNPRVSNGLKDFLAMNLLPNIDGIYRKDLMTMSGLKSKPPTVDAVLLSHAHADHADYISFLHPKIPIYMGKTTQLILQAIEERSGSNIEREILSFKERPINKYSNKIPRRIITFKTGTKLKIGDLEVEPIHVDHSVPGSYGFIIYTSAGPIVYTGDVRMHGTKPEMTKEFIDKAKQAKPLALITEGTRIHQPHVDESEKKVYNDCQKIVNNTNRLVLADFNFKDVDRLRTFYDIAKENDRKLVIKLNDAFFLKYLSKDPNLKIPKVDDKNIIIYVPKRGSGKYSDVDYKGKELQFVKRYNAWKAEEIAKEDSKVLCCLGFYSFTGLIDINPEPGTVYIHSASEPHNEEEEISNERKNNWLERFGMKKFQSHCSGHARGTDLSELVKQIDAKTLYPIHTEHPEVFKKISKNTCLVIDSKKYIL